MRTLSSALCLALAAAVAAQDPNAARVDRATAVRHYAAVEGELRAAPTPLNPTIASRRGQVIDALRDYRERGDFGVNHAYDGTRVPLFIDADGRRCAVAWLLDRTGHGDLTLSIAGRSNRAWVAELVGDPHLTQWLSAHGLTAAEAVRIQYPGSGWQPLPEPTEPPPAGPGGGGAPPAPSTGTPPAPTGGRGSGSGSTPAPAPTTGGTGGSTGQPGPGTPRTGGGRGMPLDSAQATWLDWWEWNRGTFELPQRAAPVAAPTTTTATIDASRSAAELLTKLAESTHVVVRASAVQALGRIGAAPDQIAKHLDDGAREVRFMALLGLGSGGTAAHAHALATEAKEPQQGETLAVAIAGLALFEDGPSARAVDGTRDAFLTDRRPSVHAAAALAASGSTADATRAAARAALQAATSPAERADAAAMLGKDASDEDVATLTALANDKNVDVRRSASLALGRSGHALALPALMSAFELEHESTTRAMQLLAIGDHGGDAGKAFLLEQLADGSKPLRAHAAIALGMWGRGRDANDIAERVASAYAAERNRDNKGAYLLTLGLLRHAPSRNLIANEAITGATSGTRGGAAAALGLLGDRAALPVLQEVLRKDSCPWCRQQAARSLQALGADAIDALTTAMKDDKDATVQRHAAFALGGIADPRAAAALLAFAADESQPAAARGGAALGLGRHFRKHEPKLPSLRFQHNQAQLPAIAQWAFSQEL